MSTHAARVRPVQVPAALLGMLVLLLMDLPEFVTRVMDEHAAVLRPLLVAIGLALGIVLGAVAR